MAVCGRTSVWCSPTGCPIREPLLTGNGVPGTPCHAVAKRVKQVN